MFHITANIEQAEVLIFSRFWSPAVIMEPLNAFNPKTYSEKGDQGQPEEDSPTTPCIWTREH